MQRMLRKNYSLALYFDPYSSAGSVHLWSRFLCIRQPRSGNAEGLHECFGRALSYMGIDDVPHKLIGFGCDGTNVNIGERALKGLLQAHKPWLVVCWCMAHRLELAIKDALRGTFFSTIDEQLMRAYYLYAKSPKKCRDLQVVVEELKCCLTSSTFPTKRGSKPLRACGTRFIAHKVAAMERMLDRFGAYICHLITLTEDASTKATDKQKLKGYVKNWTNSKVLLGCAVFHDSLKPAAILCKVFQSEELCIVSAVEALLKTENAMEKLKCVPLKDLPSMK